MVHFHEDGRVAADGSAKFVMVRSLLKYPCAPRENALGWMARRERRAYPQRSVRSEQRRQTAQSALALRVASLFGLARVAPQSQTAAGMLLRRALARPKIEVTRGTWVFQQTPKAAELFAATAQPRSLLSVGTRRNLSASPTFERLHMIHFVGSNC